MSTLPSKWLRYFVVVAATAVAFIARFLLRSVLGDVAPFLMFTLSVVVSAWYGGLGPGLLATALGEILGAYFFIQPIYSFLQRAERVEEVIFLGIGISISILSQARLSLLAKRQHLLASERDARRAAEDARKVAEDANRLKDEFLCAISHELRTPVLRQNLITIDIVDFLQPSATLYWYERITILAVSLFKSITQRSMQFGS